jgi:hypothetical protein
MNVVVNFLSMLGHEAETGGVHRMLGVCSEFERIAKVVIDKTEKEHSARKKRKSHEPSSTTKSSSTSDKPSSNPDSRSASSFVSKPRSNPSQTPRPMTSSSATPQPTHSTTNGHLSPGMNDNRTPQTGYSPMTGTMSQSPSPGLAPVGWGQGDFSVNGGADGTDFASFADLTGFGAISAAAMSAAGVGPGGLTSPPLGGGGIFQQPMLPQDLFSLPMTLDWDWAEMSGGAYPSVENGNFGRDAPPQ